MMRTRIETIIRQSVQVKQEILSDTQTLATLESISLQMVDTLRKGGRIWFCGNGGSAADAQHLAAEFSGRFYLDRQALPAEALHCNSSYLTAVANDYGYDQVYARLVDGIGMAGDVLVGLSTSGQSVNIIRAFEKAREKNIITVALTGAGGGQLAAMAHHLLAMPSTDTPRIQEAHILMGHIICELVEQAYFSRP